MTSNQANDGRSFEKDIVRHCQIYAEQGHGYFQKVEPPVRVIGWGPNRKVIFLENPFLDFCGVLCQHGGRACHFELKSTSEPTLHCGEKNGFHRRQREALSEWRRHHAAAFLLWEYNFQVRIFFECMIAAGMEERKSLVFDDGLKVPAGNGFLFWDFLAVLPYHLDIL